MFGLRCGELVGLLDSLEIKGLVLRNRIVMPPMQTGLATVKGEVTERLVDYYVRRCAALGLLIVEHSYVSAGGRLSLKQLGIYDDELIFGLERLAGSIHSKGTPVVVQITHAGRVAVRDLIGGEPVGPSATGNVRELTPNEVDALADDFALAAERAVKAGFDGVELHGAHGFLLNQFFSPLVNKRGDDYGGSLEKRMRFPLLVVERVRETVKGRLLLYRLGADDLDRNGTQIEDAVAFAEKLEQSGVDIIDVSGGLCGSEPKQLRSVQGYFVPQASAIKKAVHVPVIGVGGITEAAYADSLVRESRVDLVAVGRSLYKDPRWAENAVNTLMSKRAAVDEARLASGRSS
jgi:2,4-dienoyl-CoA reductase-like NADH-dependent reductase (Old Yellow Enzyme family)